MPNMVTIIKEHLSFPAKPSVETTYLLKIIYSCLLKYCCLKLN